MIERSNRRRDHLGSRPFITVAELILGQLTRRMARGRCDVCGTHLLADDPLGLIDRRLAHADCVVTDWLGCEADEPEPRLIGATSPTAVGWAAHVGVTPMTARDAVDPVVVPMRNPSNQNSASSTEIADHAPMTEDDFTPGSATGSAGINRGRRSGNARRGERSRLRYQTAAVEAEIRRLRSTGWPPRTRVSTRQADA